MAENSYPFADQEVPDSVWSAIFDAIVGSGVPVGQADNALRVFADSTGMQVKVPAGNAFVRGHFYMNTAEVVLPIGAAAGSPRIDTVALQLEYGSVNDIHLVVIAGTPATAPVAPDLTQTSGGIYQYPLANVRVEAGASTIAGDKITDRRLLLASSVILQQRDPGADASDGKLWVRPVS